MQNKFINQSVACKNCGKLHEIKCYPIINFQSASDEFIKSVFSLELFKITCDCGAETIVSYDTVIIDMYKKYIVYLYSSGDIKSFYDSILPALEKMFSDNEKYKEIYNNLNHTRLVTSINEMLEKLLIFDYDLEDTYIECIKLSLYKNEKIKEDNIQMIFFDKLDGKNLLFTLISNDSNVEPKMVGIDIEYYNNIIDAFNKIENNKNTMPFVKIDSEYIFNIINKYSGQDNLNNDTNNVDNVSEATDTTNTDITESNISDNSNDDQKNN